MATEIEVCIILWNSYRDPGNTRDYWSLPPAEKEKIRRCAERILKDWSLIRKRPVENSVKNNQE